MAQPWGVSAMETTSEPHQTHGSTIHRLGEHIKNTVTLESHDATKQRNKSLEQEHTVSSQSERNAAYAPQHHVAGTNFTVEQGAQFCEPGVGAESAKR